MAKRPKLGRGFEALLRHSKQSVDDVAISDEMSVDNQALQLSVDLLQRGKYQPRTEISEEGLGELADSIRVQGIIQPIIVRSISHGRYEIVAGERRWRAAQIAGLHEVPVLLRDIPDQVAIAIALIENIQRENLTPLEESTALRRLIDEFEMTHQQVAEAVGRSRASVSNLLRLQELEGAVKHMLESGDLEMGHARALLGLQEEQQIQCARIAVSKGLNVRETERLVQKMKHPATNKEDLKEPKVDPDINRLQIDLSEKLGARVELKHSQKGRGKLVIQYNSMDELDGIIGKLT
jgi:ParB family transcriptional regulator, chromosome partitioning protein